MPSSMTLDQRSDWTSVIAATTTSPPPMTMPTAGPATEIATERARDNGFGGTYDVRPPSPARVITGSAPVVRATNACPSSWTRTATVARTTQTTTSRNGTPGYQPSSPTMTRNEMSTVTGKPKTRTFAIGRPPST